MPWTELPTFEKARRRETYRRLARAVVGEKPPPLTELDAERARLRLFDQSYLGVGPIEVDKIVGTAARSTAFDKDFLPLRAETRERWTRLEQLFLERGFPPIVVYKLGDSYYVVDGHHRVAISKQHKADFIDAEVTELHPRRGLPEGLDVGRIIFAEQQRLFMEESGLDRARPDANIEFSRPHGYLELLELIRMQGYCMSLERGELVPPVEVAADWYDAVYLPALQSIRRENLGECFPEATQADIFLVVYERRRALFPERGDMTITDTITAIKEEKHEKARRRPRLPRRRPG